MHQQIFDNLCYFTFCHEKSKTNHLHSHLDLPQVNLQLTLCLIITLKRSDVRGSIIGKEFKKVYSH